MVGNHNWNIDHLTIVTTFLNSEIDDDDINITLPEVRPEDLNAPMIVV